MITDRKSQYCLTIRTVMRDDGKYPLDPPGVKLYQQLQLIAASVERVMVVHPSALLKKLSRMLTVWNLFQQKFEQLMILFSWIYHIAHLLKADSSYEDAQPQLLTFVHQLQHSSPHEELLRLVAYVEKITVAFTPHLFDYLKQPLLPRTNNDLELFIGRIKKSRRHVTGRKNTQEFILWEGCFVAILLGFPQVTNWVDVFAQVNPHDFYHTLNLLRQTDKRSKCWRVRRNLGAFLAALEQPWVLHEWVLQRWGKKAFNQWQRPLSRLRRIPFERWMNSGHLSTPSATGYGCGEPLNVEHVGLWVELLSIVLTRPADPDGILCQVIIRHVQYAVPINWKASKPCSTQHVMSLLVKQRERRHRLSDAIIHGVNGVLIWYERHGPVVRMNSDIRYIVDTCIHHDNAIISV